MRFTCGYCRRQENTEHLFTLENLHKVAWAYDRWALRVICDRCIKAKELRVDDQTGYVYKEETNVLL